MLGYMRDSDKLDEKIYQYLIHLFDTSTSYDIHEFLINSEIFYKGDWRTSHSDAKELIIKTDPEIYKKYQGYVDRFADSIAKKLSSFSKMFITHVEVFPSLERFQFLSNRIIPILTPWEEINDLQNRLLDQLRTAKETQEFQNIGNSSRTILQKLSNIVYDPSKHKALDPNIDLSAGKFKNRLHSVIKSEIADKEIRELRDYGESIVTTAEKSIDLANKLTHDLNAVRMMAESCVISVVSVISFLNLILKK
jgi:hypothetical protein